MRTRPLEVLPEDSQDVKERLWRNSAVMPSGCREWTRFRNYQGYGLSTYRLKNVGAHRLSFATFNGPIPEGLVVMHACDNPSCIEPGHLSLGTHEDNVRDCHKKGRHWSKKRLSNTNNVRQKYCRSGLHEMTEENTIINRCVKPGKPWLGRQCRTCKGEREKITLKRKRKERREARDALALRASDRSEK